MWIRRTLAIVALAVLATVYSLTGYAALFPQVSSDYRAYFIDHSTTCWPHDAAGTYQLGQTVLFSSEDAKPAVALQVCGWSFPEQGYTWTDGSEARLKFLLPNGLHDDLKLQFRLFPNLSPGPTQRILLMVGQTLLTEEVLSQPDSRIVAATIPASLATGSELTVRILTPDAAMPSSQDGRRLGVAVQHVVLDRSLPPA